MCANLSLFLNGSSFVEIHLYFLSLQINSKVWPTTCGSPLPFLVVQISYFFFFAIEGLCTEKGLLSNNLAFKSSLHLGKFCAIFC